ncbi:MAG: anti-sigma F factor [Clostridia bacterium]|nr:anti-sigma F factor [Clostridia bacterium]
MKKYVNEMRVVLPSHSANEALCRSVAAAFVAQFNPTIEEISDIKCAVSEAVTNAIVHGYRYSEGEITLRLRADEARCIYLEIKDKGCGIENIEVAMQPLYTTDPEGERSGMGFAVMQTFTDKLTVRSRVGRGTVVAMRKQLS